MAPKRLMTRWIAITVAALVAATTLILPAAPAEADRGTRAKRHSRQPRRAPARTRVRHRPVHKHKHYPRRRGYYRPSYRPYWGYGYRPYWGFGTPYSFYYGGYVRPHRHTADCPADHTDGEEFGTGWELYANGKIDDAMRAFADAAGKDPEDGVARAGVALTTAEAGDLDRAIWAMRRALRVDAEGVGYAPIEGDVAKRVARLIDVYRQRPDNQQSLADRSFMLAALHHLADQDSAARIHVRVAIEHGDDSTSATNLDEVLRQQLAEVWGDYGDRGVARGVR